jgi:hypothetical protein
MSKATTRSNKYRQGVQKGALIVGKTHFFDCRLYMEDPSSSHLADKIRLMAHFLTKSKGSISRGGGAIVCCGCGWWWVRQHHGLVRIERKM